MICADVSCVQNDYSCSLCSLDLPLAAAHKLQTADFEHSFPSNSENVAPCNGKRQEPVDADIRMTNYC